LMRKTVLVSWIVWTVLEVYSPQGGLVSKPEWTMRGATESKDECQAELADAVQQLRAAAPVEAAELVARVGNDITVRDVPNGVVLIVSVPPGAPEIARRYQHGIRRIRRVECWPAGADPRGTR
jgi:hypothetical protein